MRLGAIALQSKVFVAIVEQTVGLSQQLEGRGRTRGPGQLQFDLLNMVAVDVRVAD